MSLIENILKSLEVATTDLPISYRVTLLGELGAHVEGVKKILDVTPEKVIFEVKNGKIIIEGCRLKLTSFTSADASIKGKIISVVVK